MEFLTLMVKIDFEKSNFKNFKNIPGTMLIHKISKFPFKIYTYLLIFLVHHYKLELVYFFTPFCTVVSITDNLSTKKGNSSIFGLKSAVYNQEWVIMACVR